LKFRESKFSTKPCIWNCKNVIDIYVKISRIRVCDWYTGIIHKLYRTLSFFIILWSRLYIREIAVFSRWNLVAHCVNFRLFREYRATILLLYWCSLISVIEIMFV
jgi:hypothetical protein